MDYFIAAIVLGAMAVWLWDGVDDSTVFGGVILVGLVELVVER